MKAAGGVLTANDPPHRPATKSGTLTFGPGESTKTITIEVKDDRKKESTETCYLDLFGLSSNALFTKNRGLGMIENDDGSTWAAVINELALSQAGRKRR